MAGIDESLRQPRPDAVKTVNYFPTGPWIRPAPQLTASRAGVTTRLGARCHFRPHGGSNAPGKQTTMTRVASRAPGVPRRFNPTPQVAVALAVGSNLLAVLLIYIFGLAIGADMRGLDCLVFVPPALLAGC